MPEKPPPETLRDRSVRLGMESDAVVRDSADIVGRMDGVSNRKQDEPRRADPETKAETASRRLEEEIIRDELDEPSGHDSPARRPGARPDAGGIHQGAHRGMPEQRHRDQNRVEIEQALSEIERPEPSTALNARTRTLPCPSTGSTTASPDVQRGSNISDWSRSVTERSPSAGERASPPRSSTR